MTAVAIFIFNRPKATAQLFEQIAQARPTRLLIVGDGARCHVAGERERVAITRAIVEKVDWPCTVQTNYASENMGCRNRLSSGLDWVFSQVEEAIILEDDCIPHPSFFPYCDELLTRYRHDKQIVSITGNNCQLGQKRAATSYYFSAYPHIWGWASWRRVWERYDLSMRRWPELRATNWLRDRCFNRDEYRHWYWGFELSHQGKIDSWDFQWVFSCWLQDGLAAVPNENLIRNIGYGELATHTTKAGPMNNLASQEIVFPLVHPTDKVRNVEADQFCQQMLFWGFGRKTRLKLQLKNAWQRLKR